MEQITTAERADAWDRSESELSRAQLAYMNPTAETQDNDPEGETHMADEPTTPAGEPAGGNEPGNTPAGTPASTPAPASGPTSAPANEPAGSSTPDEKKFSQADVDRIVSDRLARQKGQFKDYDLLKDQASKLPDLETQINELTAKKTETEQDFNLASHDALVLKVALDKGVPADLVDRLRGNTREEIEADAAELIKKVGPRQSQQLPGGFGGGTAPSGQPFRGPAGPSVPDQAIRKAAGF
jgi:Domain of unknown function (DUF4355)